ncbi:hypothetical protein H663_017015 [Limnohabitans planktonicus II-D5]|uniref:Uncharacterized protein n=1 Tax=Limnohabitans planktonicus II-D5 TaxID=1293045 RepID=A0A2T7U9X0_9BURK|nr:hypothetical protein H663_017015 [Limnohabitans planktonicus II-D5]|eukprot:gene24065-29117_t
MAEVRDYEKDVALFKLSRSKKPMRYDGKIFVRKLANTDPTPISPGDEFAFFDEFCEQSTRYAYHTQ